MGCRPALAAVLLPGRPQAATPRLTFTTIDYPAAVHTALGDINARDDIAGYYRGMKIAGLQDYQPSGLHEVEVLFAGCCSAAPPPGEIAAYAGSPVLALHYR